MIVIVPSRGRPQNVAHLLKAWHHTQATATLLIATDMDDPTGTEYGRIILNEKAQTGAQDVRWATSQRLGMVGTLNRWANLYTDGSHNVEIVGFMGDDHLPRTARWDARVREVFAQRPGIVYCNDLLQGANLPTQVFISASIVRALGHMAPPFKHLYVDNYWKHLGEGAGCLTYLDDVVIEHMHPVAGKAEWDDGYKRVNDGSLYAEDQAALVAYVNDGNMRRDIDIVRGVISGVEAV